jgi:NAD(P)-dependent dehydrogenase (short-subunit alcohol dehydrogenase family)
MSIKTVIVTGASTGIGKETARKFLANGCNVVMNSQSETNLNAAYEEFGRPGSVVVIPGDVGKRETGEALVAAAFENFGSLDVLVNNAGIFEPKAFLDVEEHDIDRFITTNLKGTYFTTQATIRRLIEEGRPGSIVNIGSILVDHAISGFPATAPIAIKGGIHALTVQLAAEFAPNNIRVNSVAPGVIRSAMQKKIGIENVDDFAGLHLLGRVGEATEIADAIYYLANADFVTGEILNVDGGHVAGHSFA